MTVLTVYDGILCITNDHGYDLVLSPIMTYHRMFNKSNTTGVTSEAGTTFFSGTPEFANHPLLWVRIAASYYPFGILKFSY